MTRDSVNDFDALLREVFLVVVEEAECVLAFFVDVYMGVHIDERALFLFVEVDVRPFDEDFDDFVWLEDWLHLDEPRNRYINIRRLRPNNLINAILHMDLKKHSKRIQNLLILNLKFIHKQLFGNNGIQNLLLHQDRDLNWLLVQDKWLPHRSFVCYLSLDEVQYQVNWAFVLEDELLVCFLFVGD